MMRLGTVAKSLAQPLPQVFAGRMQGAGPESTGPRMERKESTDEGDGSLGSGLGSTIP